MDSVEIGDIANYYGGLRVVEVDGKYYWTVENYDTDFSCINEDWKEIPKSLYDALIEFEEKRQ